jgi:hypothetical protein
MIESLLRRCARPCPPASRSRQDDTKAGGLSFLGVQPRFCVPIISVTVVFCLTVANRCGMKHRLRRGTAPASSPPSFTLHGRPMPSSVRVARSHDQNYANPILQRRVPAGTHGADQAAPLNARPSTVTDDYRVDHEYRVDHFGRSGIRRQHAATLAV